MKYNFLKFGLFVAVAGLLAADASAQRTPRRRNNNNTQPTSNPSDTIPQQGNNNNTQPPVGYDVLANLPVTYDTIGSDMSPKKSLRNDNAFDKGNLTQRSPLPYEHLRWDDALYAEKVWRELDLREKMNKTFMYEAVDDNGSQMFVNMLMKVVQTGEITAFADDRFTTPLAIADVQQLTAGKLDSNYVYDTKQIDKVIGISVSRTSFDAKLVTKIRLKEEWVFDRESSRMFVRILGIGLLKTEYFPNTTKERGTSSLFWVYYPDLRPTLAKAEVYNPKNMGQSRMTWEELFESRMFSSYIVKSTIDNASNKMIRNYINDPILRLLEGDNIKEKIFNFEQDLWSY
ncbi:MAG: gliding motility protein GldN [Chitinophagaceae bacterium]|jgi:gliding motility associated protien GldN|nr:gliding motility protein GldN [Chitinophagaceae bacterium]MBK7680920.1 gliding motility protein GldN [Chitinophagaceae bacterium]MBK8300833.1 gliding motility protein GldN [Chitinophagaceae bacterium]MBK9465333.1 gliding motility protein GldN [Chitinophagaceae bacterium]MBK9660478.1 gliding motility protein GldN [Chitinophagaceae bacterium]